MMISAWLRLSIALREEGAEGLSGWEIGVDKSGGSQSWQAATGLRMDSAERGYKHAGASAAQSKKSREQTFQRQKTITALNIFYSR